MKPGDAARASAGGAMNANLAVALATARAGLRVFPAEAFYSGKWQKKPHITGWQQAATTDEAQVRRWWKEFPNAVPGIELRRAGLVLIDADRHPGGADGVAALTALVKHALAEGKDFPRNAPATFTPGNGEHRFFRQPDGKPLGNRSGALPAGIDVRGDGGWAVAPGSVRPDGAEWQPASNRPSLADAYQNNGVPQLPSWLADIIRGRRERAAPQSSPRSSSPSRAASSGVRERKYAATALDRSVAELAGLQQGNRNTTTNNVALAWISTERN